MASDRPPPNLRPDGQQTLPLVVATSPPRHSNGSFVPQEAAGYNWICTGCRKSLPATEFYFYKTRKGEWRPHGQCRTCVKAWQRAYRLRLLAQGIKRHQSLPTRAQKAEYNRKWFNRQRARPEFWIRTMFAARARGAAKRSIPFDITAQFLTVLFYQQGGRCALTGRVLICGANLGHRDTASLDRVEPSRGYVTGNVRWVTYQANVARNKYGDDELYLLAEALLKHRKEKQNGSRKTA